MATLQQVRVTWTGFIGAPGVSTFYFAGVIDDEVPQVAVHDLFEALAPLVPSDVTFDVEDQGVTIDSTTGQPNGTWSGEGGGTIPGSGSDIYSAPSGAVITWHTGSFAGGREIRGRTFVVPLSSTLYDGTGNISGECQAALLDAAADFITAGGPSIYSPTTNGNATVASATVPRRPAVLRSRRD